MAPKYAVCKHGPACMPLRSAQGCGFAHRLVELDEYQEGGDYRSRRWVDFSREQEGLSAYDLFVGRQYEPEQHSRVLACLANEGITEKLPDWAKLHV